MNIGNFSFNSCSPQKSFVTAILRPYEATRRVCSNYYGDECEITIVSGMPEGIGKTGYVHHVLSDVYGYISRALCVDS